MIKNSISSASGLFESRRGASRREVTLPCQAVREHDFKLIADRTLDISTDGLFLPLRTRVLTTDQLIVSFSIPGMWIDAEATVARVVHGRRPGDDGLACGIVFNSLSVSSRAALAGFLHGRRAPLPRRGPLARLRRGENAPQLADEMKMQAPLVLRVDDAFASADDDIIEEVTDDDILEEILHEQRDRVDGLNVLRAVLDAWQSLANAAASDVT